MRHAVILSLALGVVVAAQQLQPFPKLPAVGRVRPIAPPATPLPSEARSAAVKRFAFIAFGDTRCDCRLPEGDTARLTPAQPETEAAHREVVDGILAKVKALANGPDRIRFVAQSGDATYRGADAERWNVFTPIVERMTRGANLPFFFVPGNHDVTGLPPTDQDHQIGLHNTLSAISKLIPPEGSPRRLNGYATFAVGFGNLFLIGIDSNLSADVVQLAWVTDQLEHLNHTRYQHIVVLLHHPPFTSGRYSGVRSDKRLPNGMTASASVSSQALAIRGLYLPLFRKHHVRLIIAGHDHLFDHWVERYTDQSGKEYRLDQIVSGGGGAPTYVYVGEPNLTEYTTLAAAEHVRLEHLARSNETVADNPHHFLVIYVNGGQMSVEVVPVGGVAFAPYNGRSRVVLSDRTS